MARIKQKTKYGRSDILLKCLLHIKKTHMSGEDLEEVPHPPLSSLQFRKHDIQCISNNYFNRNNGCNYPNLRSIDPLPGFCSGYLSGPEIQSLDCLFGIL